MGSAGPRPHRLQDPERLRHDVARRILRALVDRESSAVHIHRVVCGQVQTRNARIRSTGTPRESPFPHATTGAGVHGAGAAGHAECECEWASGRCEGMGGTWELGVLRLPVDPRPALRPLRVQPLRARESRSGALPGTQDPGRGMECACTAHRVKGEPFFSFVPCPSGP